MPFRQPGWEQRPPYLMVSGPRTKRVAILYTLARLWPAGASGVQDGRNEMRRLIAWLVSQERAVENAREASTDLCRRSVERREVEIYLAERLERVTKTA